MAKKMENTKKDYTKKSRNIGAIVGPTLIVMVSSELKVWNATLYNSQIAPLVYLSGVLLFVAGISVVRSHNLWVKSWQLSITILGWLAIPVGLLRMYFPQHYLSQFKNDITTLMVEVLLILLGFFISFNAYWPAKKNK